MNSQRHASAAVLVLACLFAVAMPSVASAVDPYLIGMIAANSANYKYVPRDCKPGQGASDREIAIARRNANDLMDAYVALTLKASASQIGRVLRIRDPDFSWKDSSGPVAPDQLAGRLGSGPKPRLDSGPFAVAGDADSLRGVWRVTSSDGTITYLGADVIHHEEAFGWTWRILKLAVFPADSRPPNPAAYCHLDLKQGW